MQQGSSNRFGGGGGNNQRDIGRALGQMLAQKQGAGMQMPSGMGQMDAIRTLGGMMGGGGGMQGGGPGGIVPRSVAPSAGGPFGVPGNTDEIKMLMEMEREKNPTYGMRPVGGLENQMKLYRNAIDKKIIPGATTFEQFQLLPNFFQYLWEEDPDFIYQPR